MDPNKYTSLDNLFRQRVNPTQKDDNAWDVPPDFLLDNALETIESEDSENKKYFWLYFISITLITAFAIFTIQTNTKVNELQGQVEEIINIQKNQNTQEPTISSVDNISLESNFTPVQSDIKGKQVSATSNISNNTTKSKKTTSSISRDKIVSTAAVQQKTNSKAQDNAPAYQALSPRSEPKAMPFIADRSLNKKVSLQTYLPISGLSLLSPKTQTLVYDASDISLPLEFSSIKESKLKTPVVFFLSAGLNSSSFSMKNVSGAADQLTKYDDRYLGYDLKVGLNIPLTNRLEFSPALGFSLVNNSSNYTEEMKYDTDNEILVDGHLFYESDYHVESPMGSLNRSTMMAMGAHEMTQDDLMMNKTDITNSFSILGLKADIRYALLQAKAFNLGIKTGLGLNYIVSQSQNMNTKLYHDSYMLMDENYSTVMRNDINPLYTSVSLSLDLRYQISQRVFFGANLGGERSLSSLRKTSSTSDVKTYLNGLNSNLFFEYQF